MTWSIFFLQFKLLIFQLDWFSIHGLFALYSISYGLIIDCYYARLLQMDPADDAVSASCFLSF